MYSKNSANSTCSKFFNEVNILDVSILPVLAIPSTNNNFLFVVYDDNTLFS